MLNAFRKIWKPDSSRQGQEQEFEFGLWTSSMDEILETAQSPNSSFPFLFDFGLGLGTWTRACQFARKGKFKNENESQK